MKLHELQPNFGAKRSKKRVGRGPGAGQGKTAGKGTKGQSVRQGAGAFSRVDEDRRTAVRKIGCVAVRPRVEGAETEAAVREEAGRAVCYGCLHIGTVRTARRRWERSIQDK